MALTGQTKRWRWLAVEIREELDLFEWNAMFEGTMFTYGSGTFSWAKLLLLCGKKAMLMTDNVCRSHSGRGHLLQCGAFTA